MRKLSIDLVRPGLVALGMFGALGLQSAPAHADIELLKTDDVTVFVNGRMQAFLNYNNGYGPLKGIKTAQGTVVEINPGSADNQTYLEIKDPASLTERGKIEELRIRTGFVGNVLGFGFRHRLNDSTDVTGYTAVTTYIDSTNRRKYQGVVPDWRESYLKVKGDWGSVVAGRTLGLFNRGATEITYLYAYRYGLGWVGDIGSYGSNGPGAGHVGFGVLANGFAGGLVYATPTMSGAQLSAGLFDANNQVGNTRTERVRWPRLEAEVTYESDIGEDGMFKLFANGAHQKVYAKNGDTDNTVKGLGLGGRVEYGMLAVGIAGHAGQGIGISFALQPSPALSFEEDYRDVDGGAIHVRVAPSDDFDFMTAWGVTRIHQLPQDKADTVDDDMNPATPSSADKAGKLIPTLPDSVTHITMAEQFGVSFGGTYHFSPNLHLQAEYFRAMHSWHKPTPAPAGVEAPEENFDLVNLGVTYDF